MNEKELRELDAWIAEHLFDFAWCPSVGFRKEKTSYWLFEPKEVERYKPEVIKHNLPLSDAYNHVAERRVPYYTTDPAAAMMVLEKCAQEDSEIRIFQLPDKSFRIGSMDRKGMFLTFAQTLPLAICLFAKKLFTKPLP